MGAGYPPQAYPIVGQQQPQMAYPGGPQSRTMMGVGPLPPGQSQPPPYGYPQQAQYPGYPQQPYPGGYPQYQQPYPGQSYPPYAPYPSGMGPQGAMGPEMQGGVRPRKKSTLVRDIVIGIVIAAVALGAFAVVKFVILDDDGGDGKATTTAKAPSLVVTVDGDPPARVFVDGVDKGTTAAGTLTIETTKGKHAVKVERAGVPACEKEVDVGDSGGAIECKLGGAAGAGSGSAAGSGAGSAGSAAGSGSGSGSVMVADAGSAAKPPDDKPDKSNDKPDKSNDKPDKSNDKPDKSNDKPDKSNDKPDKSNDKPPDKSNDKPPDKSNDKPLEKGDVGYLVAYTTPFARVYVDGVDTGKSTPIVPRGRLELKPGKHKLTFEVDGQKHHYSVTIEAGKTLRFTKDLPN
jgi:hypothetical protein